MPNWGLQYYWPMVLGMLAVVPWWVRSQHVFAYPALGQLPADALSRWLQRGWRVCGAVAILAISLALAGPYWGEQRIELVGKGAHVMVVLDRSASMNDDFADKPAQGSASKMAAARKVLQSFVAASRQDLMGMVTFSTSPILVAPLGGDRAAMQAALAATAAGGMGFTAVARGLGLGLQVFENKPLTGARVILLVSDGAAHLDVQTQDLLRNLFQRQQASLYWIYLRSASGPRLTDKPQEGNEQSYPEYELHRYFQTLGVSYHAYEADNPRTVQSAMAAIAKLKNQPVRYYETAPRHELSGTLYALAMLNVLALLVLQLTEIQRWRAA